MQNRYLVHFHCKDYPDTNGCMELKHVSQKDLIKEFNDRFPKFIIDKVEDIK
jgi:hypothetical protein